MFASMSDLNFIAAASGSNNMTSQEAKESAEKAAASAISEEDEGKGDPIAINDEQSDIVNDDGASDISQPRESSPTKPHVSIITAEQRLKMTDSSNHWKVRTSTIDEIHIAIQSCIEVDPQRVLDESQSLLEFFVSLLSDQNFKIVLMTLSIINLVIAMPQHLERG